MEAATQSPPWGTGKPKTGGAAFRTGAALWLQRMVSQAVRLEDGSAGAGDMGLALWARCARQPMTPHAPKPNSVAVPHLSSMPKAPVHAQGD